MMKGLKIWDAPDYFLLSYRQGPSLSFGHPCLEGRGAEIWFQIQSLGYKKSLYIAVEALKKRRRHTLPRDAVPSALTGLTSLFGMGRGEPRCYNHLKSLSRHLIDPTPNKLTYLESKNIRKHLE